MLSVIFRAAPSTGRRQGQPATTCGGERLVCLRETEAGVGREVGQLGGVSSNTAAPGQTHFLQDLCTDGDV